jgi:hypothetical protein
VTADRRTAAGGSRSLHDSLIYRLLLGCLRVAWCSCAVGMIAMLAALVLRSPALVAVFQAGLIATFAASAGSVLLSLPLLPLMDRYGVTRPGSSKSRADALVAVVLADLLDAE